MTRIVTILALLSAFAAPSGVAATDPVAAGLRPASVLKLPENVQDVIIAETSSATLHHFTNVGGELRWRKAYYMSIGQNGVPKQRAWDKRTPLGIYFINEQIDTTPLHDKYGVAAYALDYPNAWDRLGSRTGYGIWLHGVDRHSPRRPPRDTDGCLALPNAALLELADKLERPETPVLVAETMRWEDAAEIRDVEASLSAALERWRKSVVDADLGTYLASYGDDFRQDGLAKADWASYRMQVFDTRPVEALKIDDLMLLADPVEKDLYLTRFQQTMTLAGRTVTIMKRLYWRRLATDRWVIVAEAAG